MNIPEAYIPQKIALIPDSDRDINDAIIIRSVNPNEGIMIDITI